MQIFQEMELKVTKGVYVYVLKGAEFNGTGKNSFGCLVN